MWKSEYLCNELSRLYYRSAGSSSDHLSEHIVLFNRLIEYYIRHSLENSPHKFKVVATEENTIAFEFDEFFEDDERENMIRVDIQHIYVNMIQILLGLLIKLHVITGNITDFFKYSNTLNFLPHIIDTHIRDCMDGGGKNGYTKLHNKTFREGGPLSLSYQQNIELTQNYKLFRTIVYKLLDLFRYVIRGVYREEETRATEFRRYESESLYKRFNHMASYIIWGFDQSLTRMDILHYVLQRNADIHDPQEREYNNFLIEILQSKNDPAYSIFIKVLKDEPLDVSHVESIISSELEMNFVKALFFKMTRNTEMYKECMVTIADTEKSKLGNKFKDIQNFLPISICEFMLPLLPLMELPSAVHWSIFMHQNSLLPAVTKKQSKSICLKMMQDHYDCDSAHNSDVFDMMCKTTFNISEIEKFLGWTMIKVEGGGGESGISHKRQRKSNSQN